MRPIPRYELLQEVQRCLKCPPVRHSRTKGGRSPEGFLSRGELQEATLSAFPASPLQDHMLPSERPLMRPHYSVPEALFRSAKRLPRNPPLLRSPAFRRKSARIPL